MREDVGVNSQKNKPEETDILRLHSGPGCMSTTHERDTSLAQSVEATGVQAMSRLARADRTAQPADVSIAVRDRGTVTFSVAGVLGRVGRRLWRPLPSTLSEEDT